MVLAHTQIENKIILQFFYWSITESSEVLLFVEKKEEPFGCIL